MDLELYKSYLDRLPVAENTRRNYWARVRAFFTWLDQTPETDRALASPVDRDFTVKIYRSWLLKSGHKPSTINGCLAALDNYFVFSGLGPSKIKRHELPQAAPRALEPEELKRVQREVERLESIKNKCIMSLLINCGLRISELCSLNAGDVHVSARKGEIIVRHGKGAKFRVVPLNSEVRSVLLEYLRDPRHPRLPDDPLFKSQLGTRISPSALDYLVKHVARLAGVEMSAHTLRHSCISRLIRSGIDIVIVAEVAGHQRLETTRRYSLPTVAVKAEAMEKLIHDSA